MAEYTYNPILAEVVPPRFTILRQREAPEPGVALVVYRNGEGLQAHYAPDTLTAGEFRWGRISKVYRIDISEHALEWQSWLPCKDDRAQFLAHLQLRCAVSDPVRVVTEGVRDAYSVLEPLLIDRMRHVSRGYAFEYRAGAEEAISAELRKEEASVGFSRVFELRRISVRVHLDADVRDIRRQELYRDFYLPIIEQGQWSVLALNLAKDPNAVSTVVAQVLNQHNTHLNLQLEALKAYLDKDALEGFQLEEPAKDILRRLATAWQMASTQLPRPLELEAREAKPASDGGTTETNA